MKHLKLIKTTDDHSAALSRLDELMDSDPVEGSQAADELELLAMLIEQYEAAAFPMICHHQLTPYCFAWINKT